ncbi:MAG: thiol:disulfide interchange protein DsbA/DsbL [Gammaproteobacteria bacterium]|nr:thiol:disulfide interchange protein DsbA/DsbL [Gammaproteobacteria bacterium]MCW8986273.1 thiol:disulfide interchange protein DsbA/DsbL [Gammaproteobacteria bacterium]MCW9032256.1 thiol:disulfide interchange protein DsbA/DsbL [Gammaproteobacteria bacterium]
MKCKLFMAMLMAALFSNVAIAAIDEGIEYKRVSPAQPTITRDKVEVVELFWYGCPHCFHFEPDLNKWLANKPDNVAFVRVPAVFNSVWALHARAYYAAETLGLYDNGKHEFHEAFFEEIHKHKKRLDNKNALRTFFARFGVSAEDFNNTFESFAVNTKVSRAATLSKRYQLDGVPTLIVNGKYRTDGPMAGGRQGMLKVLDFLIKKESKK